MRFLLPIFALAASLATPAEGEPPPVLQPDTKQPKVTSPFGPRMLAGKREDHNGIDLRASEGTGVLCPVNGHVVRIDKDGVGKGVANGNAVCIEYGGVEIIDGREKVVIRRWFFCHLSKVTVGVGESVRAGHLIGATGNTGHSTGPHLHISVWNVALGGYEDPLPLLTEADNA